MHTHSADAGDNLLMTDPNAAKNGRGDEESCLPRACADGCKRHCPAAVQYRRKYHQPRRCPRHARKDVDLRLLEGRNNSVTPYASRLMHCSS